MHETYLAVFIIATTAFAFSQNGTIAIDKHRLMILEGTMRALVDRSVAAAAKGGAADQRRSTSNSSRIAAWMRMAVRPILDAIMITLFRRWGYGVNTMYSLRLSTNRL